ncbi:complement activation, classical pathway [Branchiostoma belcheri]|nr:complement activation, classical pathway [Branchiostoma belcheri]
MAMKIIHLLILTVLLSLCEADFSSDSVSSEWIPKSSRELLEFAEVEAGARRQAKAYDEEPNFAEIQLKRKSNSLHQHASGEETEGEVHHRGGRSAPADPLCGGDRTNCNNAPYGFYPDLLDCAVFHECPVTTRGNNLILHQCPDSEYFDWDLLMCKDLAPMCAVVQCPSMDINGTLSPAGPYYPDDVVTVSCNPGFELEGVATATCLSNITWSTVPTCRDIDECAVANRVCGPPTGTCTNTPGSYTCTCNPGYISYGGTCTDINQCTDGTNNCHADAFCANVIGGSFTCTCKPGYTGDGVTCTGEEGVLPLSCPTLTAPVNGALSATGPHFFQDVVTFTCDQGYGLNGVSTVTCQPDSNNNLEWSDPVPTCIDVDECADGSHNCSPDATCTNTPDVDECVDGSHSCDPDATCTNTPGSFTCACNPGYSGDGFTCTDDDECADGSHNCSPDASCANTNGSFTCTCNTGYIGDGLNCIAPPCPTLTAPANGGMSPPGPHYFMDFVTFTCNPGYVLSGASPILCGASTNNNIGWSHPVPTCTAVVPVTTQTPASPVTTQTSASTVTPSTTADPTTFLPTTADPTTLLPTTADPTTLLPTTADPTTFLPTTADPTTFLPTTADPTTFLPTTADPTTLLPTTVAPLSLPPTATGPTNIPLTTGPFTYGVCVDGWTPYYSIHQPNRRDFKDGDFEPLGQIVTTYNLCGGDPDLVWDISCREVSTQAPWDSTGAAGLECDTPTGFYCSNSLNYPVMCEDYEISVNCNCAGAQVTTGPWQTTTSQITTIPTLPFTDNDECTDGSHNCSPNATCTNTPGSFTCSCNSGYSGDGVICTPRSCPPLTAPTNGAMTPTGPYYDKNIVTFTCNQGYKLNGASTAMCQAGSNGNLAWSHPVPTCTDNDECVDGSNNCNPDAFCTNTPGSFTCTCKAGYSGDGVTCTDDDECADGTHNCNPDATCTNTPGSFNCACNPGYTGDGVFCFSVNDQCASGTHNCSPYAFCVSTSGSVTCTCYPGYSGDGVTCTDNDECADGSHNCDIDATCTNTPGSFTCACNPGYIGDGVICNAVPCPTLTEPVNGALSLSPPGPHYYLNAVTFTCNSGYKLNGATTVTCQANSNNNLVWSSPIPTCTDVDECTDGSHHCSPDAFCTNTPGSFTCTCNAGYSGDGVTCTDDDECADGTDNCSPDATCTNTPGSFTCACNSGYTGDGVFCFNANDQCADGSHNCSPDAFCVHHSASGSFTCTCYPGYSGDGVKCTDDDECADATHNCSPHATCTNTPGSFTCACNSGYIGNGVICNAVPCPTLTAPANGGLNPAGPHYFMDIVTFTCNPGYKLNGVPTATCQAGSNNNLEWSDPVPTCTDNDECVDGSNNCNPDAFCTNTPGSFTCTCKAGYSGNGVTCTDVDECADGTHNCHLYATCTNTPGSFTCTCNPGYSGDGVFCFSAIDQCAAGSHNCSPYAFCVATSGSFTCSCHSGYSGNGVTCTDNDECSDGTHNCNPHATCTNTPGSFTCACNPGYSGDGVICNAVPCLTLAAPVNGFLSPSGPHYYQSTVTFTCNQGYELNGASTVTCQADNYNNLEWSDPVPTCTDVDECGDGSHNCAPHATCTNTPGSFTCGCKPGYSGDGFTCTDVGECADGTHNCSPYASCFNTVGSFVCACELGYNGNGVTCTDEDECTNWSHNCSPDATCTNTPGSFTCACNSGYSGDGVTCTDADECADGSHNCSPYATCTNTPGSFTCDCNLGYSGDGFFCFSGNDLCLGGSNICSSYAFCTTKLGAVTCTCLSGYSGDGFNCIDNDECADGSHNCHPHATCTNTPGSFKCACNPGYTGDGVKCTALPCSPLTAPANGASRPPGPHYDQNVVTFTCNQGYKLSGASSAVCQAGSNSNLEWSDPVPTCTDKDECADDSHNCSPHATCTNTPGSFTCTCNAGYSGDGVTCTEVDECTDWSHNCSPHATCTNTPASFTCTCNLGYSGDGVTCTDNDECADGSNNCSPDATCFNTPGSFTCICNSGYIGDGFFCFGANDQCTDGSHNCSPHAFCTNTQGSVTCTCSTGYNGDGATCADVDECADDSHNCSPHATCTNTSGSFTCTCDFGYFGDGVRCTGLSCPNLMAPDNGALSPMGLHYYEKVVTFNCNQGFELNGATTATCQADSNGNLEWSDPVPTCTDNDECADGGHNCNPLATCTNTPGSFTCTCKPGYFGDGILCFPVSEKCPDEISDCDGSAFCTTSSGSPICICKTGYHSRGGICKGRGEFDGSFTCTCDSGYSGDGVNCVAQPCPTLTAPANGALSPPGPYYNQHAVGFICNPGYVLNGTYTATCQAKRNNLIWSDPVPTCTALPAPALPPPGALPPGLPMTNQRVFIPCNQTSDLGIAQRRQLETNFREKLFTLFTVTATNVIVTNFGIDFQLLVTEQDRFLTQFASQLLYSTFTVGDDVNPGLFHLRDPTDFTDMVVTLEFSGVDFRNLASQHSFPVTQLPSALRETLTNAGISSPCVNSIRVLHMGQNIITFSMSKDPDSTTNLTEEVKKLETAQHNGALQLNLDSVFSCTGVDYNGTFDSICPPVGCPCTPEDTISMEAPTASTGLSSSTQLGLAVGIPAALAALAALLALLMFFLKKKKKDVFRPPTAKPRRSVVSPAVESFERNIYTASMDDAFSHEFGKKGAQLNRFRDPDAVYGRLSTAYTRPPSTASSTATRNSWVSGPDFY